jgi:hypothetical protein
VTGLVNPKTVAALVGIGLLAPEDAEAMYVGPMAKGWKYLTGKFSSLADRQPRAEISDAGAKVNWQDVGGKQMIRQGTPLSDAISHPELFENYPNLSKIKVFSAPINRSNTGDGYYRNTGEIGISPRSAKEGKQTLLHEIQHIIQGKERWAMGGNPNDPITSDMRSKLTREAFNKLRPTDKKNGLPVLDTWKDAKAYANSADAQRLDVYPRLAGEIEARDTASRMGLNTSERSKTLPYSAENIPLTDWITKLGLAGGVVGATLTPQPAQTENWRNYKNKEPALQEPIIDPTTLLAGPARWGGGLMNLVANTGLNAIMGKLR